MRKFFLSLIAAAGLMGFAAVAQADCDGLQMVEVEQDVVVTGTTPVVLTDQSGG